MKEISSQRKKSRKRSADKTNPQPPRNTKHKVEKSHGNPITDVYGHINHTINFVSEVKSAAEKQLCYLLVATAMANVEDGVDRFLKVNSLAYQAFKKGFRTGEQCDFGKRQPHKIRIYTF